MYPISSWPISGIREDEKSLTPNSVVSGRFSTDDIVLQDFTWRTILAAFLDVVETVIVVCTTGFAAHVLSGALEVALCLAKHVHFAELPWRARPTFEARRVGIPFLHFAWRFFFNFEVGSSLVVDKFTPQSHVRHVPL